MKTPSNGLKSEKLTFIVVICIMLFSLIYMSSYSLLMKNKIELFQQEMQAITREMNVLMKYLPERDSLIQIQKEQIVTQMQEVQAEITRNQTSSDEREKLRVKLWELKSQVEVLSVNTKEQEKPVAVVQQTESMPLANNVSPLKDSLLQSKEAEIARLKTTIVALQSKKPSVIVQNKLAMYYFTVVSPDTKNRASKTKILQIQFQVKGNVNELKDKNMYVEVRDPFHKIISSPEDKIRVTNHFVIKYDFEPYNYEFVKGKYSIKIYSPEAQFQSITFLTLN